MKETTNLKTQVSPFWQDTQTQKITNRVGKTKGWQRLGKKERWRSNSSSMFGEQAELEARDDR